jgi:hypothetical protein
MNVRSRSMKETHVVPTHKENFLCEVLTRHSGSWCQLPEHNSSAIFPNSATHPKLCLHSLMLQFILEYICFLPIEMVNFLTNEDLALSFFCVPRN